MKLVIDGVSQDDGLFHLTSTRSMNNKLVLAAYKKEALRANVSNGFARPDQKVTVKGLEVLMDAKLNDGTLVLKGSLAYVKEESLHTQAWAQKNYESDAVGVPFILADATNVEFFTPPKETA